LLEETLRLTRLPFEHVFKASSAAAAIESLEQNEISVVLLDLSLPDSSGFNSYSQIEAHASAIPIIVLTGLSDTELALETMSSGAQDYLIKGEFDERLLAKSIQYSLERNRIRLSLIESNESYRNLFFNNPLSILDLGHGNTLQILEANDVAQKEYGYTRDELLNMSGDSHSGDESEHEKGKAIVVKAFQRKRRHKNVGHLAVCDQERRYIAVLDISSHKIDYKGRPAVLAIHNNITEKVRLEEKLAEEKLLKQKEITEAMIQVQEKERYEISTELHDNVNQQLTVAMMYIASAQQKHPDDAEVLKQSSGFILNAIEEISKLSQTLVSPNDQTLRFEQSGRRIAR
jgi:two-component system sensor histidine kinase UhpB